MIPTSGHTPTQNTGSEAGNKTEEGTKAVATSSSTIQTEPVATKESSIGTDPITFTPPPRGPKTKAFIGFMLSLLIIFAALLLLPMIFPALPVVSLPMIGIHAVGVNFLGIGGSILSMALPVVISSFIGLSTYKISKGKSSSQQIESLSFFARLEKIQTEEQLEALSKEVQADITSYGDKEAQRFRPEAAMKYRLEKQQEFRKEKVVKEVLKSIENKQDLIRSKKT